MTTLVDTDAAQRSVSYPFTISPDGGHFVIVTRSGDLTRDVNEYNLYLFDADRLKTVIGSPTVPVAESVSKLATFSVRPAADKDEIPAGISHVKWSPDGTALAFIGRDENSHSQVFTLDIATRELRQITNHHSHVVSFDVTPDHRSVIFSATPLQDNELNWGGYVIRSENVRTLAHRSSPAPTAVREHHFQEGNKPSRPVKSSELELTGDISLSPNGRWAIARAYPDQMPVEWIDRYESWRPIGIGEVAHQYRGNPAFHEVRSQVTQFALLDLESGKAGPVVDAPVAAVGAASIHWLHDGEHAVIVNTHRPLSVSRASARSREGTAAILEVHPGSWTVTVIDELPVRMRESRILDSKLIRRDMLWIKYLDSAAAAPKEFFYRREAGKWSRINTAEQADVSRAGRDRSIVLSVSQDMNTPPEIHAYDLLTGQGRTITDLNPHFQCLWLGEMEVFSWTDTNSRQWEGGLLYPPTINRSTGGPYPLVIQTYGFSQSEFLMDGPGGLSSAFAARPLAGRGLMVLQMPNQPLSRPIDYATPTEGPAYVAAYEGAVQALKKEGLIDPDRVGLIGWSRTGMHVSYAVTFSDVSYAAATIADATSAGYLSYVYMYGDPPPGMVFVERQMGGPFWGDHRKLWLERSPNFNLHKIRTPLRLEAYGARLNSYWGMFAILSRQQRPVEMVHIPVAAHSLRRPLARFVSQEGNVDWHSYWLLGYVDEDPQKADQYERWARLRAQQFQLVTKSKVPD